MRGGESVDTFALILIGVAAAAVLVGAIVWRWRESIALIEACAPETLDQPVRRVIATPGIEGAQVGRYAHEYTGSKPIGPQARDETCLSAAP